MRNSDRDYRPALTIHPRFPVATPIVATAPLPPDGDRFLGTIVGGHRIVRRIGAGGMGVVYEAVHGVSGRRVAVKVLHPPHADDPRYVRQLLREAQALRRLRHPGLVEMLDVGRTAHGSHYLVMEYLEGETLRARLQRRPLDVGSAVRIVGELAAALSAAHATGIVHQDVKPANVMLIADASADGGERVKLLDFGLARELGEDLTASHAEWVVGTTTYLSPERCLGDPVTAASDVYALGVILFEMLTGAPPFAGSRSSRMRAHLRDEVSWPALPLPAHLVRLTTAMLAKPAAARPTMDGVLRGLAPDAPAQTTTGGELSATLPRQPRAQDPPPASASDDALCDSQSIGSVARPRARRWLNRKRLLTALAVLLLLIGASKLVRVWLAAPDARSRDGSR